ncbi:ABC transporter permease [Chitinispirillales bacterium ANBcel5]|uniref:ABC transporter permease n=1 Tax=Cellulosispirillum alkaliphilum TaxID=3039283 RepID=UPI002A54F4FE|nr:ABC transporter permease [Chitinispirillales bacterium ANBcel5]
MNPFVISFFRSLLTALRSIAVGSKMAVLEMASHKLRSALSVLGVMLGVTSLVTMLTLIGGIDVYLNETMGRWIGTVRFWQSDMNVEEDQRIALSRSPGMRFSDGQYLVDNSPHVVDVHSEISRWLPIQRAGINRRALLRGLDSDAMEYYEDQITLLEGRWLNERDYRDGIRNCIISQEFMKTLSAGLSGSIIGETITAGSQRFRVVGVFGPVHPANNPGHLRRGVFIPLKAMQKYITGLDPDPGRLQVQVSDPELVREQAQSAARVLASRHRGVEDFAYRIPEWVEDVQSMLGNISVLMSIISVMSLLVGGLSIMNVMLSSISERIREIGVRKALGANNFQIFIQFVAETTTLSFFGGAVGMVLGTTPLLIKDEIMTYTQGAIEPVLLPLHLFYTGLIITSVGILFGLYPALKASRMDPVDALRYE